MECAGRTEWRRRFGSLSPAKAVSRLACHRTPYLPTRKAPVVVTRCVLTPPPYGVRRRNGVATALWLIVPCQGGVALGLPPHSISAHTESAGGSDEMRPYRHHM